MHGRQWHDHEQPKEITPEAMTGLDAAPDIESSGQRAGMGRLRKNPAGSQGRVRRKRTTPPGKGPKQKPGAAKKISQSGMKTRKRA
jgi:hypothetical protein